MLENDLQVLYPYVWEREEDQEKIQIFTEYHNKKSNYPLKT